MLLDSCMYICLSIPQYVCIPPDVNQCEMSLCNNLLQFKAFPLEIREEWGYRILCIPDIFNWYLSKQSICWPVSHDHIVGPCLELIKVTSFFFKLITAQVQVFDWIIGSSQVNLLLSGALLLGLTKIYILFYVHTWKSWGLFDNLCLAVLLLLRFFLPV